MSVAVGQDAAEAPVESLGFDFADRSEGAFGLVRIGPGLGSGRSATALLLQEGREPESFLDPELALEEPQSWDQVRAGPLRIEAGEAAARASFEQNGAGFVADVRPDGAAVRFDQGTAAGAACGAAFEVTPCLVSGELIRGRESRRLDGRGRRTRSQGVPDWPRLAAIRSLAIDFEDGGALSLLGVRPVGASGHGEEALTAFLAEPGMPPAEVGRVLLSTEYDRSGRHRRAGVELQLEEEGEAPPMRAAGTELAGLTLDGGGFTTHVGFFGWTMQGRSGVGRYEVEWRGGARGPKP